MKKLVLSLAIVAAAFSYASAQGISGGVKAGLNLANLGGDDVEDVDIRPSFHVGGYVNIGFTEKLSLQPELLFNSVGAKSSYEDSGFKVEETLKLSYISVPVNLVYSFGAINIHAGPQFGFLMSAKSEVEVDGESDEEDVKDSFKGLDLGFGVGLGANFGKFNASARYTLGLSNIVDADDADVKNNVIQLSVGYRLFGGE
jgi:hypothetical protein